MHHFFINRLKLNYNTNILYYFTSSLKPSKHQHKSNKKPTIDFFMQERYVQPFDKIYKIFIKLPHKVGKKSERDWDQSKGTTSYDG